MTTTTQTQSPFMSRPVGNTLHTINRLALDGQRFKVPYLASSLKNAVDVLNHDHVLSPALSYDKIRRQIIEKGSYVATHKLCELPNSPSIIISIVPY